MGGVAEEGEGSRGVGLVGDAGFPFLYRLAEGEGFSYLFQRVSIMREGRNCLGEHLGPLYTCPCRELVLGECKRSASGES